METILLVHVFATVFMTGLCWFVQVVHYPLFRVIDIDEFPAYERKNGVTAYLTVPVMIVELFSGLYLLYIMPDVLHWVNVILLGVIGLSTMIYQVPMHLELMIDATPRLITRLIRTNWIRTLSWTVRSVVVLVILSQLINQ